MSSPEDSPPTSGVPVPGAAEGSATSMSTPTNTGPAAVRSRTRAANAEGGLRRSSSIGTSSRPSARACSRSAAAYTGPLMPAISERRGSSRPSSTARRMTVPWNSRSP